MGFRTLDANGAEKVTLGQSVFTLTTTGTIDDLDFSNADLIRFNNASLATLRGLKAGSDGQRVTIVSIGAGEVDLAHQNTNSAAANRVINFVTGGITPLAPGIGTATYQYDVTTARWRLITHDQGAPIDIAYSAGNFTASGSMTWTVDSGDQIAYKFLLVDRVLSIWFTLNTTSVGGTANTELRIAIPNGYLAVSSDTIGAIRSFDNGTDTVGFCGVVAAAGYVRCWRSGFSNWALSTNNTSVQGMAEFGIS